MSSQLLLDEMYTGLKEYLEALGWQVTTVQEAELQGAKDKDIAAHARKNQMILITQDSKTAELAEMIGARQLFLSNALIAKLVDSSIREKYPAERV